PCQQLAPPGVAGDRNACENLELAKAHSPDRHLGRRRRNLANLSRTYSRLRDEADLPRDLVLYLARHECETKVCRQKGIEFARRLLGHASTSTTQRHVHLDDRELAEAQDLVE